MKVAAIPDLQVDPVTVDIIENALRHARFEMDAVLFRSAMSPVIREQHDEFPMLTDPQGALAEENTVALALTGLASLARTVRMLAAAGPEDAAATPDGPGPADDLVHVLVALAHLGEAAARLAGAPADPAPPPPSVRPAPREWLR